MQENLGMGNANDFHPFGNAGENEAIFPIFTTLRSPNWVIELPDCVNKYVSKSCFYEKGAPNIQDLQSNLFGCFE